jgi:hypothetical protein
MEIVLAKDKITKNCIRYGEQPADVDHPIEFYLPKDKANELGNPDRIRMTIVAE